MKGNSLLGYSWQINLAAILKTIALSLTIATPVCGEFSFTFYRKGGERTIDKENVQSLFTKKNSTNDTKANAVKNINAFNNINKFLALLLYAECYMLLISLYQTLCMGIDRSAQIAGINTALIFLTIIHIKKQKK